MSKTIAALYDELATAHDVVLSLSKSTYFPAEDISIISQDTDSRYARYVKELDLDDTPRTAASESATAGSAIGALVGLLLGASALLIPGVGPILALGPVGTALAGAGAGAVLGGLTGALVGMGIDERDAKLYTDAVRHGATLVLLRSPDTYIHKAVQIMREGDPIDIEARAAGWSRRAWIGDEITSPETPSQLGAASSTPPRYDTLPELELRDELPELDLGAPSAEQAPSGPVRAYAHPPTIIPYALEEDFRRHLRDHPPADDATPRYEDYEDAYALGAWLGHQQQTRWDALQAHAQRLWADQYNKRDEAWDQVEARVHYAWHRSKISQVLPAP
jgi:uncharacterized membrane protein